MVEHPHVLEQPVLVQTFITIVTVVTTKKEVVTEHVCLMAIGVMHQLVKGVCGNYILTLLWYFI